MKRILSLLVSLVFVVRPFLFAEAAYPVCIIGAGPAGLTIATGLQAKGFETIIFEKNPEVGGKCQAYYDGPGLFHPMGALLFSNETYRDTLPIIDASGLTSILFDRTKEDWLYDYKNGHVKRSTSSLSDLSKHPYFKAEIDRYTEFWTTKFAPYASIGYKKGVEGYTISTFDWLLEHDYPLLLLLFVEGMVPYGYSDVRQIPIIYMLQYFTPDILLFFAGQHEGYIIDFHEVFVRYANHIKGPLHLNTQVTKIDRSGNFPLVTYNDPNEKGPLVQNCSKLVLAFPPVLHALQAANLDIDHDETVVFSPVGIIKYWSGAVRVVIPYRDIFAGFLHETFFALIDKILGGSEFSFLEYIPWLPKAGGEPVAFLRILDGSDIATTWSWGKYKSDQTLDEAKNLLIEVMSKLNKDPDDPKATPVPITDDDVKEFTEWDYFPHFDQPQLEDGFYVKFNALQGHKNTYYASGLNGFETVEFAVRAGKDVVDTYFESDSDWWRSEL